MDNIFFSGYAEFGAGGKDNNRDDGRKVVQTLKAATDSFDMAAVLMDRVKQGVFVPIDIFNPELAMFTAVN